MNRSMPRVATAVATLLLIWNMIGVVAFALQYSADLAEIARADRYQAHLFATMPAWAWMAYGVAVLTGTAGAFTLLLGNRLAVPFFLLSLAGIVGQFGHVFLFTDLFAVKGWDAAIFPIIITLVALIQIALALRLKARGYLR